MADPEKDPGATTRPHSNSHSSRGESATTTTDVEGPKPASAPATGTPAEKSSTERERVQLEKANTRLSAAEEKKADDIDALYAHLPPHEAEILKRQVVTPDVKSGVLTLYRYSSRNDLIIIVVSALAAIASGAALPLMTVLFGSLQGTFQDYFMPGTSMTYDDFMDEIIKLILYFVYLAIGEFVSLTGPALALSLKRLRRFFIFRPPTAHILIRRLFRRSAFTLRRSGLSVSLTFFLPLAQSVLCFILAAHLYPLQPGKVHARRSY